MESFSAVVVPQEEGAPDEEPRVKSARKPFDFGRYSLIFLLLAMLLLLGTRFYKARLGQDNVFAIGGESSPVQPVIDNRSPVVEVLLQPAAQPPVDASPQEEVVDAVSDLEEQQFLEPESAAEQLAQPAALDADPAPPVGQGTDFKPYQEDIAEDKENLTDEALPGNTVQGTAISQAEGEITPSEDSNLTGEFFETKTPDSSVAALEEDAAEDAASAETFSAEKPPAIDHLLHVEFGFDSAQFTNASESVLQRALELLSSAQDSSALISGYADNQGGEEYNLSLSRQRAETVARYLTERGVQRSRLQVEGLGPVRVSANTEQQEAQSIYNEWRIVEIRITVPAAP